MIRKQISNISGHQTSKVFAMLYMLITIPFVFIGIIGFFSGATVDVAEGQTATNFPWLMFIFAPLFYGGMGYIFTRFGCFAYNFVAKRVGGIEFTVTENENSQ